MRLCLPGPRLCRRHGHHQGHCPFRGVPVVMLPLHQETWRLLLGLHGLHAHPKGKGGFPELPPPTARFLLLPREKAHWASGFLGRGRSGCYRCAPPTETEANPSHRVACAEGRFPCRRPRLCSGAQARGPRPASVPCTRAASGQRGLPGVVSRRDVPAGKLV